MVKTLIGCLAALVLCGSSAMASLIVVQFDGFTAGSVDSTNVFTTPAIARDATISDPLQFTGGKFSGNSVLNTVSLNYSVTSGNWGDVFATNNNGAPGTAFDGFRIVISYAFGGDATVSINGGSAIGLNSGINDFRNVALPTENTLSLDFVYAGLPTGSFTIQSVSAVPEATGLLLVGVAVAGGSMVRRRRKA